MEEDTLHLERVELLGEEAVAGTVALGPLLRPIHRLDQPRLAEGGFGLLVLVFHILGHKLRDVCVQDALQGCAGRVQV